MFLTAEREAYYTREPRPVSPVASFHVVSDAVIGFAAGEYAFWLVCFTTGRRKERGHLRFVGGFVSVLRTLYSVLCTPYSVLRRGSPPRRFLIFLFGWAWRARTMAPNASEGGEKGERGGERKKAVFVGSSLLCCRSREWCQRSLPACSSRPRAS